jgi:predicted small metal-binding protein
MPSYQFACADAGCVCSAAWESSNPDDIVAKVAAHLQAEHNVKTISNTLANFVKANIQTRK